MHGLCWSSKALKFIMYWNFSHRKQFLRTIWQKYNHFWVPEDRHWFCFEHYLKRGQKNNLTSQHVSFKFHLSGPGMALCESDLCRKPYMWSKMGYFSDFVTKPPLSWGSWHRQRFLWHIYKLPKFHQILNINSRWWWQIFGKHSLYDL